MPVTNFTLMRMARQFPIDSDAPPNAGEKIAPKLGFHASSRIYGDTIP